MPAAFVAGQVGRARRHPRHGLRGRASSTRRTSSCAARTSSRWSSRSRCTSCCSSSWSGRLMRRPRPGAGALVLPGGRLLAGRRRGWIVRRRRHDGQPRRSTRRRSAATSAGASERGAGAARRWSRRSRPGWRRRGAWTSCPTATRWSPSATSARVLTITGPDHEVTEVGTIGDAAPQGEGGLLGVAVSPASTRTTRCTSTSARGRQPDRHRDARRRPAGRGPKPIFTGIPLGPIHDGGRLAFGPDGMLYASTGETGDGELAQDRDSLGGKILRLTPEGKPAPGNPFDTAVWSFGHRNVQGLAFDGTASSGPRSSARTPSTSSTGSTPAPTTAGR